MTEGNNETQWFWAAGSQTLNQGLAGERFVVAKGQRELWSRVCGEVDPDERPHAWMGFGALDGKATLADCVTVFLQAVHTYGVSFNRAMLELARVPAWASYVRGASVDLCNMVSNPTNYEPLPREPYDRKAEQRLGDRLRETLGSVKDSGADPA